MSLSPHPIASLKAALKARLLADAGVAGIVGRAVYAAVPAGANPPFIAIGDAVMRDNGGTLSEGAVIDLDLLAVARERASLDVLAIASAIEASLGDPLPVLNGHRLISLESSQTLLRHDVAGVATSAAIRLHALTEPL
jgi:hypothetical protein